ncbi:MAG: hypothetical protein SR1Q5_03285 [Quinella sp. 1Q5]|nr:hypothetical protein [Quinella sp. 1Q5]
MTASERAELIVRLKAAEERTLKADRKLFDSMEGRCLTKTEVEAYFRQINWHVGKMGMIKILCGILEHEATDECLRRLVEGLEEDD